MTLIPFSEQEAIDKDFPSPLARAEEVYAILQIASDELELESSGYDIMCFCIQYLAGLAVGGFDTDERFVLINKSLSRWLNELHYNAIARVAAEEKAAKSKEKKSE